MFTIGLIRIASHLEYILVNSIAKNRLAQIPPKQDEQSSTRLETNKYNAKR
jgi:hypothetical protein